MTEINDLYYCGGLFDGEGFCGLYLNNKTWQLMCGMEMANKTGIDKMISVFGGIAYYNMRHNRDWCKGLWRLQYSGSKAFELLNNINPYTIIKKELITLTTNYWAEGKVNIDNRAVLYAEYKKIVLDLGVLARNNNRGNHIGRPKGAKDKRKRNTSGYINRNNLSCAQIGF